MVIPHLCKVGWSAKTDIYVFTEQPICLVQQNHSNFWTNDALPRSAYKYNPLIFKIQKHCCIVQKNPFHTVSKSRGDGLSVTRRWTKDDKSCVYYRIYKFYEISWYPLIRLMGAASLLGKFDAVDPTNHQLWSLIITWPKSTRTGEGRHISLLSAHVERFSVSRDFFTPTFGCARLYLCWLGGLCTSGPNQPHQGLFFKHCCHLVINQVLIFLFLTYLV